MTTAEFWMEGMEGWEEIDETTEFVWLGVEADGSGRIHVTKTRTHMGILIWNDPSTVATGSGGIGQEVGPFTERI
jgi:hypothetical protein